MTRASPLLLGLIALALSSCQLVAGVRNDGELEGSTASSASAGGATSSSSDASSTASSDASSSSSSMVPLCGASPCAGACIDDICYIPSCLGWGNDFDVLGTSETVGKTFGDALPTVVSNGKAVVAVVDEVANELLVRDVDDAGVTGPVTTFPLGANARFAQGRATSKLAFQGRMNGEIGEIRFDYMSGGVATNGTFVSFGKPSPCGVNESVDTVFFSENEVGDIIYAASCSEQGGPYKLVIGSENDSGVLVASSTQQNPDEFRLVGYAYSHGTHLILTGDGAIGEQPHYRSGGSAAALATATPLRLSSKASTKAATFLLTTQEIASADFVFWGADVTLTVEPTSQLWAGVFADPATLDQSVPPPGFAPFGALLTVDQIQAEVGAPGHSWADPLGIYLPMRSVSEHHAILSWLSPEGVPYLIQQAYFAGTSYVRATAASPVGQGRLIVTWVEEDSGTWSVRGRATDCVANPTR